MFGALRAATGTASTEYRFTGQQDDGASGLLYLRARYYDPSTGRFLTKDPWRGSADAPITLNRYAYVANVPTDASDPDGRCFRFTPRLVQAGCAAVGSVALAVWRFVAAHGPAVGTTVSDVESEAPVVAQEAQAAVEQGTHMALGLESAGLDQFAAEVGGQTWKVWGQGNFKEQFLELIERPTTRISFNLDGVDSPWAAVTQAARGAGGATDWELLQLKMNPDALARTAFFFDGQPTSNPFG